MTWPDALVAGCRNGTCRVPEPLFPLMRTPEVIPFEDIGGQEASSVCMEATLEPPRGRTDQPTDR
jgi:hypothetical protein